MLAMSATTCATSDRSIHHRFGRFEESLQLPGGLWVANAGEDNRVLFVCRFCVGYFVNLMEAAVEVYRPVLAQ